MDYKGVFQLAESKGYQSLFIVNEETVLKDDFLLCELSLIQKWLRGTHGIHVQPQKTFHNKTFVIGKIPIEFRIGEKDGDSYGHPISHMNAPKKRYKSYEEALLEGINKALELI